MNLLTISTSNLVHHYHVSVVFNVDSSLSVEPLLRIGHRFIITKINELSTNT